MVWNIAVWELQLKQSSDNYSVVHEQLTDEIRVFPGRLCVCSEDINIKSSQQEKSASLCKNLIFKNCIVLTPRNQLESLVALFLVLDRFKEV